MITPNQILRDLPNDELRAAAREALDWHKTGILPGTAVRGLAERMVTEAGISEDGVIPDTAAWVLREAASRFAAMI